MKAGDPRWWWKSHLQQRKLLASSMKLKMPRSLPITNILLPFQERGQAEYSSGTSSSLTTVHRLPKTQGLGTSSSKRSADLPLRGCCTQSGGGSGENKTPHHSTAAKGSSQGSLSQDFLVRQLHAEKPLQTEPLALPVCSCPRAGPLPGLCNTARVRHHGCVIQPG